MNVSRPPLQEPAKLLASLDQKHLWHPFTQMRDWEKEPPLVIEQGEGVYLIDSDGRRYLDGVSSLWCNVHGHRVPEIDQAIRAQLDRIAHSTFLGLTHPPAIQLAEKLIQIAPQELSRVFYSDSGSEAVEIALKMAFQYWQHRGQKKKTRFARLTEAYHGDTLGAVSVGGIDLFHEIFHPLLFETYAAPTPHAYRWPTGGSPEKVKKEALAALEKLFQEQGETIAAFVIEPVIQGAAGMLLQPAGYLSSVRELTKKYNTLLIFDEVATGFGRTGTLFACEQEKVSPDLMTVAKGLTGGYLPLAATLVREEIYEAFLGAYEEFKTFFHGHTYTANPLACAAAMASLDLFKTRNLLEHVQALSQRAAGHLEALKQMPIVGDTRQAGLMIGIELVQNRETREPFPLSDLIGAQVTRKARHKGAILRPLGSVVVLMPILAMTEQELDQLFKITAESIEEVSRNIRGQGKK